MRTLSAALLAAQRAATRQPFVQVVISDRFAYIRRLRPTNWYTGIEPDGPHAVAIPTDGSLNRLRIATTTLFHQRVAAPVASSDYSPWTTFRTDTRLCALAQYGANLVAFAVDSLNPNLVYTASSADHGATWGAFALALTHSETINAIAAAAKADGTLLAVVNTGDNLSAYKRSGGVWGAAVTSTDATLRASGIACFYIGDWNIVATGAIPTAGSRLYTRIFGDGFSQAANTWSATRIFTDSAPASNISYGAPFLTQPDTFRFTFREQYTGALGPYDHIVHTHSPATADYSFNLWREPAPFDLTQPSGLALAYTTTALFLTTPSRVLNWSLNVASVDVTADILTVTMPEGALHTDPTIVVLDNSKGTYTNPGAPAGPVAAITKGALVEISPGYFTPAGSAVTAVSAGPAAWISKLEHTYDHGEATLTLTCLPIAAFLQRWRAPRTIQFAAGARNIFGILQFLFARAGAFEFSSLTSSPALVNLYPAFTINPGESALSAVRRLLQRVPDHIITRSEFAFILEPLASQAATEALTWQAPSNEHPIHRAVYIEALKPANHFRAFGGATGEILGESIDFTEGTLLYTNFSAAADRGLTTAAQVADRAAADQRDATLESQADHLTIPAHAGLEALDVVILSDSRKQLSAAKRRVLSLTLRYDRRRPARYDHVITLGAP